MSEFILQTEIVVHTVVVSESWLLVHLWLTVVFNLSRLEYADLFFLLHVKLLILLFVYRRRKQ
jgi:hypothetical protein